MTVPNVELEITKLSSFKKVWMAICIYYLPLKLGL